MLRHSQDVSILSGILDTPKFIFLSLPPYLSISRLHGSHSSSIFTSPLLFSLSDCGIVSRKSMTSAYSVGIIFYMFKIMFSVILYAVSAVYFAGVMVRLMLTLTPAVCVLAGIAFSITFEK